MLPQLTKYLLQFQQVYIPSVGTIRLVQQPASLDVANKLILPPRFVMQFSEDGWLTKHQLWHFGSQLHFDEAATRKSLEDVGGQLKKAMQQQSFTWNGIGIFHYSDEKLHFESQQHASILQPLSAERVLREGVQHTVLVGSQVVRSDGKTSLQEAEDKQWNWSRIVGWAAVVLSLFFIVFYLYQHQFSPMAAGYHQNVSAAPPPATYRQ